MTVNTSKLRESLVDQLSSFDDEFRHAPDDVTILTGLQAQIGSLLAADGSNEEDIRNIMKECYERGELRPESYELVQSILERFVTENVATEPVSAEMRQASSDAVDFNTTQKIDMGAVVDVVPSGANNDYVADVELEAELLEASGSRQFDATTVIPSAEPQGRKRELSVQVGSVLRDRFVLQQKVAGGSMGVVYKALDRRLAEVGNDDKWVAVKVLSPQLAENAAALRALQQEAAKGRHLLHPHIVRFIDLDRDGDLYFIVMEWLPGRTLADILDSADRGSIDRETAFRIVREVGDALIYAHRRGIVHADVKPGNIMIAPDGSAKLFDFGVARVLQQPGDDFDPGVLGAVTPAYSSMQVITGDVPVATDDVFSLACLLYRLVAGYRVFGPRNAAEASREGMKPQPVDGFTDAEWTALKKALSYSRVARHTSVEEFLAALDSENESAIMERDNEPALSSSGEMIVVPPRDDLGPPRRATRWGFWLFLLLLALLGLAGYRGDLDPYLERWLPRDILPLRSSVSEQDSDADAQLAAPETDPVSAATETDVVEDDSRAEDDSRTESEPVGQIETAPVRPERTVEDAERVGPGLQLVDFSRLPPPTVEVPLPPSGRSGPPVTFAVREDGDPAIIDFVRGGDLSSEIRLRLEEVGFSGNRSPWVAGQYELSDNGLIHFPVGQERGRVTLTMASDPLREADWQATLRLREMDNADAELAVLEVLLEDDDQRRFESELPPNTIGFAASQASIRETDPAVQIDLVRFNPDDTAVTIQFSVQDITATDGEDYFAPGSNRVTFGPRQRSARLLVPLVQDAISEGDEAFVIELQNESAGRIPDVYQRVVVMIRDDE